MQPKHTPGPWNYDGHGINSIAESHKGERIFKTCLDYSYGSSDRERAVADSNLIAAAPDLLEACRESRHLLASDAFPESVRIPILAQLNAAIAKAEGR